MKHRILCDCDGVLSDFNGYALRLLNRICGTNIKDHQVTDFYYRDVIPATWADCPNPESGFWVYRTPEDFFRAKLDNMDARDLRVLPGAHELVRGLAELGELWVVTSPMPDNRTWCWSRVKWLEDLGIDRHRVVFAADKSAVDGTVLIDDRADNLMQWEDGGRDTERSGVLWKQPYSGVWGGLRVNTVEDALEVVSKLVTP